MRLIISDNKAGVVKSLRMIGADGAPIRRIEAVSAEAAEAWKQVLRADPCAWCGGKGGSLDHIIARGRGGSSNSLRNWTGACAACNGKRGATSALHYLAGVTDPAVAEATREVAGGRRNKRQDEFGAAVRTAIAGISGREARRKAAEAVRTEWKKGDRERKREHRRETRRLRRTLFGSGHTSLDDPTAAQGRRHTVYGKLNRPGTTSTDAARTTVRTEHAAEDCCK